MKLRMAPSTARFLEHYSAAKPHAILLTGPVGVGLRTLALHIASEHGILLSTVQPESKSTALASIPVERIRQLYTETKSRLHGTNFVIIDDADAMNQAAQNALLKLLEEPNESICFILTSHNPDNLLPTIRSRTQITAIAPLDKLETIRHIKALGVADEQTSQRLLYIAEGLPAEISRLVESNKDFTALLDRVQQARKIVEGNTYTRIAASVGFTGDRQEAIKLIDMVVLLLRRSLGASPKKKTLTFIEKLLNASESIRTNGNIKIHLTAAMIQ